MREKIKKKISQWWTLFTLKNFCNQFAIKIWPIKLLPKFLPRKFVCKNKRISFQHCITFNWPRLTFLDVKLPLHARIWEKLLKTKPGNLNYHKGFWKLLIHISPYWVTYNAAMTAIKTRRDVDLLLQQPEKQAIPNPPWIETLSLTILFHLCRHFICCKGLFLPKVCTLHFHFHISLFFVCLCKHGAFKAAICQHFFSSTL